jgi:hypothetical protein
VLPDIGSIDMNPAVAIHLAGLDHGREEDAGSDSTSIDGGTADRGHVRDLPSPVEAIDEVRLQRSVGREIESILSRDSSHSTSLLIPFQNLIDLAHIAGRAQDSTLIAIIPRQNPEAILPGIVNDVVNFTISYEKSGNGCTMNLDWETTRASVDIK